jgi:hypothetical protein
VLNSKVAAKHAIRNPGRTVGRWMALLVTSISIFSDCDLFYEWPMEHGPDGFLRKKSRTWFIEAF